MTLLLTFNIWRCVFPRFSKRLKPFIEITDHWDSQESKQTSNWPMACKHFSNRQTEKKLENKQFWKLFRIRQTSPLISVGYGTQTPSSITGKAIGGFCAIVGVFILTLPVPIVVNSFASYYKNRLWRNEVAHKRSARAAQQAELVKEMLFNGNGNGTGPNSPRKTSIKSGDGSEGT